LKIFLISLPVILFLSLIYYLLIGWKPKYRGLSLIKLQKYIDYSSTALDNGGHLEIEPDGLKGAIKLEKKEYKNKQDTFLLSMSSGLHSRDRLMTASKALSEEGIEHKLSYTKRRHLPRRLYVSIQAEGKLLSSATTHVVQILSKALGIEDPNTFTVICWGPYKTGYQLADGDVIKKPSSFKAGFFLGYLVGKVANALRLKNRQIDT